MVDTPRTVSNLLTAEFQDGQAAGSITPQDARDFIVTMQARSWLSVKQYGATGDGATNDTTALNNALASGESLIYVPDGTYMTSGITMSTAGQMLWIAPGATIKLISGAGVGASVILMNAAKQTVTGGGIIDGNTANATNSTGVHVANAIADATIDNLRLINFNQNAIYATNSPRVTATRNRISGTKLGSIYIILDGSSTVNIPDINVCNNFVDGTASAGSGFGGIVVQAILGSFGLLRPVVSNNTIIMPIPEASADFDCIIVGGYTTPEGTTAGLICGNNCWGGRMSISCAFNNDTAITGNTCYSATDSGIELTGCNYCTASGNVIDGNGNLVTGFSIDQYTPVDATKNFGNAITGNVVRGCTGTQVHFDNPTACSASGNTVQMLQATTNGIVMNGALDCSITGGSIDGGSFATTRGVTLDSTAQRLSIGVTVSGVAMRNLATGFALFGSVAGTSDNILVKDCIFDNSGGPPISVSVSTGTTGNNIAIMGCAGFVGNSSTNGNARRADCLDWKNQVYDMIGSGSPSASVTAGGGSIYRNQAAGTGTTLYVHESASVNTTWVAK